jgi:hypothetical protein
VVRDREESWGMMVIGGKGQIKRVKFTDGSVEDLQSL